MCIRDSSVNTNWACMCACFILSGTDSIMIWRIYRYGNLERLLLKPPHYIGEYGGPQTVCTWRGCGLFFTMVLMIQPDQKTHNILHSHIYEDLDFSGNSFCDFPEPYKKTDLTLQSKIQITVLFQHNLYFQTLFRVPNDFLNSCVLSSGFLCLTDSISLSNGPLLS